MVPYIWLHFYILCGVKQWNYFTLHINLPSENFIAILLINIIYTIAELEKAEKDLEAMKSQSENLTKEYNRMADERNSMEVCIAWF